MSVTTKSTPILQQSLALDLYLQTLLADVPEAELPVSEFQADAVEPFQRPQELIIPVIQPALESSVPASRPAQDSDVLAAPAAQAVKPLSLMPEWSRSEFKALFFKVDHLILATPLTQLSRTMMFTRKPTKIPIQPSWFLGLLEEQEKKVGILDTGQLIFGKTRGSQRNLQERPFSCLLISADGNWGLACDEIISISKIFPDKVRWRTFRKQRPWLIGTMIEELTAVIEIAQLLPGKKTIPVSKSS